MQVILPDKPFLDSARCQHFANIHGQVLELGVGPGTNFRCWTNNTGRCRAGITEWVGVEPNTNFVNALPAEIARRHITFPTRTIWMKGEDLDLQPNSFDYVIGAHVLCSVDSTPSVLQQVHRALKPGGVYLFYEHIAAPDGSWDYYLQIFLQPFYYLLGSGCQFKRIEKDIRDSNLLPGYEIQAEHLSMNLPTWLSVLRPHLVGSAKKPL
eukprot:scaffold1287_cov253-Ochromonas_danica.AAC.6